jgi:tetratricopeptide (TPR) repeat protein
MDPLPSSYQEPLADLIDSGLAQPVNADIALGIDPSIISANLTAMGMLPERAASFLSALQDRFNALSVEEREQRQQSIRMRIAGVHSHMSTGQSRNELINNELKAGDLSRQQAEGIVDFGRATQRTLAASAAVSDILPKIPQMSAELLKNGYSPQSAAEMLARQWKCSRNQALLFVNAARVLRGEAPLASEPAAPAATAPVIEPTAAVAPVPAAAAAPAREKPSASIQRRPAGKSLRIGLSIFGILLILYLAYGFYLAAPVGSLYAAGDCQGVARIYSRVRRFYSFPVTSFIGARGPECALYADGQAAAARGDWQAAYQSYSSYHQNYPQSVMTGARALAAQSLNSLAREQAAAGHYEAAIQSLTLLTQYTDQPEAVDALKAIPQAYLDWALALSRDGYYDAALEGLRAIPERYVNFPQAQQAAAAVPSVYIAWGRALANEGSYADAQERFRLALASAPDQATRLWLLRLLPGYYAEWAASMMAEGKYADAVGLYQAARALFPDAASVDAGLAAVYAGWAQGLVDKGDFDAALRKMDGALQAVGDGSARSRVEAERAQILAAFATSSGDQAQAAIESMSKSLCETQVIPEDLPAIFGTDGANFFMRIWPVDSALGADADYVAANPSQMKYVVCVENRIAKYQSCPYAGGHTLIRQRRSWDVHMYNTSKGDLVGKTILVGDVPAACEPVHYFSTGSLVDYNTGPFPDYAKLKYFISQHLK